ncbi:hypothetical protein ABN028_03685 [Actinopolymorpha sp. B17G11]
MSLRTRRESPDHQLGCVYASSPQGQQCRARSRLEHRINNVEAFPS